MTTYFVSILIVMAVALFVAAPLSGNFSHRRRGKSDLDFERLEHERGLAMQGLRELEFDHEMGKLEESDYDDLKKVLEARALQAMSELEKLRAQMRASQIRAVPRRVRAAMAASIMPERRINFCPQCGARAAATQNYCAQCGTSIEPAARSASRAE
ncbi:MAG: zinc-ribbon domain-containing protein [Candidatus Binataceae bacterium]